MLGETPSSSHCSDFDAVPAHFAFFSLTRRQNILLNGDSYFGLFTSTGRWVENAEVGDSAGTADTNLLPL